MTLRIKGSQMNLKKLIKINLMPEKWQRRKYEFYK